MTNEKIKPNNFVYMHGYVKKVFLHDKVGTINLAVEEEYKGKKSETFLNVVCFGGALEHARKLKEFQYVSIQGRQARKERNGQWQQETIATNVVAHNTFQTAKKEAHVAKEKSFDAFNDSFNDAFSF